MSGLPISHPVKKTTLCERLLEVPTNDPMWFADKGIARPILTFYKWYQVYLKSHGSDLNPTQAKTMNLAENGKMIFGAATLPKDSIEFGRSVEQFFAEPSWDKLYEVTVKGSKIGAPVNDLYDLYKKNVSADIPGPITTAVKGFGPVTLGWGMMDYGRKSIKNITKEVNTIADSKLYKAKGKEKEKKMEVVQNAVIRGAGGCFDLAVAISYFIIACCLFSMFWFSVTIPAVVLLTCATSALIFTLAGKFWPKIFDKAFSHAKKV